MKVPRRSLILKLLIIPVVLILAGVAINIYAHQLVTRKVTEALAGNDSSAYQIRFNSIRVNVWTGYIGFKGFSIYPTEKGETDSTRSIQMEARSLDISGIHFLKFKSKKTLEIGTVTLNRPVFILTNADINPPKIDSLPHEDTINLYAMIKDKIKSIEIGKIQVVKGSGSIRGNDTTNLFFKIGEFNIQCSGLLLDSTIAASGKKIKLANMNVFAGNCNGHISNGLYQISIPAIHLNGLDSALVIDSISVTPTVDKKEFSKQVGYQTDCIELRLTGLRLSSGGFENLVDRKEILLALVEIDSVRMHAYRDKNIPRRNEHHDLHHTFLKNLPYSIEIEKIILHRGDMAYEELAEGAPQSGHISFTRMEGVIQNISNIHMDDTIRFKGSAYMMNQAAISATISLPLAEDRFFGSADMGPFDLAILNPMIKNFAAVDITDGKAQSMKMWFSANETAGMGEMTFTYSGFTVNTGEKEKDKSDNTVVGEIKDFIANEIILVQDNPKNDVLRVGKIGYGRDPSRNIINYCWNLAFSGIKSSVGLQEVKKKKAI